MHVGIEENRTVWSVHGDSVKGASHERSGLPNQDFISWKPQEGNGLPIMLAVADGHGSATYFRSHLGAQFAIKIALEEMEQSIRELRFPIQNTPTVKELLHLLPRSIIERWQTTVRKHWKDAMPTPVEWKRLQADPKLFDAFQRARKNPLLPYGTTLLGVIITPSFIFYFQLGDGDIQIVTEDGQVIRAVKDDSRLLANETTSLCSTTPELAKRDFRITFSELKELNSRKALPALILVSTDGYSNSFNTQEDFHKVGFDILHILSEDGGVEKMKRELPHWLQAATQAGSGDDISLGLIWNLQYTNRAKKSLSTRPSIETPASSGYTSQQDQQSGLPGVSQKEHNLASTTQEQFREQRPVFIEEVHFPDQKAPGVLDLLIKSTERPPRERWEVEQYKLMARPASTTDVTPSSQPNSEASAGSVTTQTQNSPQETDPVPTTNQAGEQLMPNPGSVANDRQDDRRQDQQRQESQTQQQTKSVPDQQEIATNTPPTEDTENRNAYNQLPKILVEQADFQSDERDETIIRPRVDLPAIHPDEPLVKDVSMEHRLIVRQHPARGEYSKISEALKHARDGTLISVYPGIYEERLTVNRDTTIRCQEEAGSVTIVAKVPCLQLSANHALIHGIRFHGKVSTKNKDVDTPAVEITKGQSMLKMCEITSESLACVRIRNQEANPTLQECDIHHSSIGIIFSDGAHGHVEHCEITEHYKVGVEICGSAPTIRSCNILSNGEEGFLIWKNATGLIDHCLISNQGYTNIMILQGGNPTISECRILAAIGPGIKVADQGRGIIQGCTIQQNQGPSVLLQKKSHVQIRDSFLSQGKENGIVIDTQSVGIIQNCDILEHNGVGIRIQQGGSAQIDKCTIDNNIVGIEIKDQGSCTIVGGQITNHRKQEIGVYYKSHIELKSVKIDCRLKQGYQDYAVALVGNCTGTFEGCSIYTHEQGIVIEDHVTLLLNDCNVFSQTSYALCALNNSNVTIHKTELDSGNPALQAIFHNEDSQIYPNPR